MSADTLTHPPQSPILADLKVPEQIFGPEREPPTPAFGAFSQQESVGESRTGHVFTPDEQAVMFYIAAHNGYVPTPTDLTNVNRLVGQLEQGGHWHHDYESGQVGYRWPSGEVVTLSREQVLGLRNWASPTQWVTDSTTSSLFGEAAELLAHPDGPPDTDMSPVEKLMYDARVDRVLSWAEREAAALVDDPGALNATHFSRLAELSRWSRELLPDQGREILRQRSLVRASHVVGGTALLSELRPGRLYLVSGSGYGKGVDGFVRSYATARLPSREYYSSRIPDGDSTLAWLIANGVDPRTVPIERRRISEQLALLKPGYQPRISHFRVRDISGSVRDADARARLAASVQGSRESSRILDAEVARWEGLKHQLEALERLEAPVAMGGAVPSYEVIGANLFPGASLSELNPEQRTAVQAARMRLVETKDAYVPKLPSALQRARSAAAAVVSTVVQRSRRAPPARPASSPA